MSAPLRLGTYARWRKMREIICQVAELSNWTKRHKLSGLIPPKKKFNRHQEDEQSMYPTYQSMINLRCSEALRSVLVRCEREDIAHVLSALQKEYNTIAKAYYYPQSDGQNSLLVEFQSSIQKKNKFILNVNELEEQPLTSVDNSLLQKVEVYQHVPFNMDSLMNCKDVAHQIMCIFNGIKLSEAKIRQHYIVGMFVRNIVQQLHHTAKVMFFGSSACGLATDGKSDLDLVILHDKTQGKSLLSVLFHKMSKGKYREFFSNLFYIRFARVPILKFEQDHTGMSCDVSSNTLSGIMMAEMLYWLRLYEPMFQPLVMAVKVWAKNHNLVGVGQGGHFSNHMLTMMVIAFLQQQGLLPALEMAYVNKDILSKLNHEDLISNWNRVVLKNPTSTVDRILDEDTKLDSALLVYKFFKFYSTFPFDSCVLNIRYGTIIKRPHNDNIYMCNPFENQHNMCQNVHAMYVDKLQNICQHSVRILDIHMKKSDVEPWGLMCVMSVEAMRKHKKGSLFSIDWAFDTRNQQIKEIVVKIDEDKEDINFHVKPLTEEINDSVLPDKLVNEEIVCRESKQSMKPLIQKVTENVLSDKLNNKEKHEEESKQSMEQLVSNITESVFADKFKSKEKKLNKKKQSTNKSKLLMESSIKKVVARVHADELSTSNEKIRCVENKQLTELTTGTNDQINLVDKSNKKKKKKKRSNKKTSM